MEQRDVTQMPDNTWVSRIEAKIDKLTEAVTAIARVEEKIYASSKRIDRLEMRMDGLETDLDEIKSIVQLNNKSAKSFERLVWVCVSIIASILTFWATKGIGA